MFKRSFSEWLFNRPLDFKKEVGKEANRVFSKSHDYFKLWAKGHIRKHTLMEFVLRGAGKRGVNIATLRTNCVLNNADSLIQYLVEAKGCNIVCKKDAPYPSGYASRRYYLID